MLPDSGADHVRGVTSLLLCCGGQPGLCSARPPVRGRRVTDRKHAGATVNRKIAVDDDAAGLSPASPSHLAPGRMGRHAGPARTMARSSPER